ncbi:predicted protein [Chaetomium globosum CBS 148.51]|uniref:Uncharacterized protein n=1 Tax=Chaetomium globosum (strain ATCC 6205 / CBS 148.51 / DSM 1962 / NBRC 6347 / NRRL 1970) TaxID=306901 RepID=Q2H0R4_CHAGB|nr:uncharacterized protein CHGG_04632 [Chaetomium globosum CBS 148.51]EAQ88013.1 predicted protein [Chaetomium globosum CBS 148.51]
MAGMSAWVVELMKTHVSNAGARVWICGGTGRAERGAQVAVIRDVVRTPVSGLPAWTAVLTAYTRLIFATGPHQKVKEQARSSSAPPCAESDQMAPRLSPPPPLKAESEENQDRSFVADDDRS